MDDLDDEQLDPRLNAITKAVIGAAIEVHRELGPGHEEIAYENALAIEMNARGIPFVRQCPIQLLYKGHVVGTGRLDFLVDNEVVVELKSVETIGRVHTMQVLSYLRITRFRLALLINFNVSKLIDGVSRIAK